MMRTRYSRHKRRPVVLLGVLATVAAFAVPAAAVTNGTPAGGHGEPYWQTARITIGDNFRSCSGKLVDDQWVVTAASCFADNPAQSFQIPAGPPSKPAIVRLSDEAVTVDGGGGGGNRTQRIVDLRPRADRDLVFAKLENRVHIRAARLPARPPQQAETLQIAGFGRTATEWVPGKMHVANSTVSAIAGATFTVSGNSDTCRGDAGGPSYRGDPNDPELAGVHGVSWQKGCFGSNSARGGSTEARVDDLIEWFGQHNPDQFINCSFQTAFFASRAGTVTRMMNQIPTNSSSNPALDGIDNWLDFGATRAVPGVLKAGPGVAWTVHVKSDPADPFNDGDLRLWDTRNSSTLTGGDRVGSGWQNYMSSANRDKITVDEKGRIYRIDPNGDLRMFVWDASARRWLNDAGLVLDTGWSRFNSITAAGDGVLYGRTADGALIRFHYDHAAQNWVQRDMVTPGNWNAYSQLVSPGGDVIYGTSLSLSSPTIAWTRYNPLTNAWATHRVVGRAAYWGLDHSISVDPHACVTVRP